MRNPFAAEINWLTTPAQHPTSWGASYFEYPPGGEIGALRRHALPAPALYDVACYWDASAGVDRAQAIGNPSILSAFISLGYRRTLPLSQDSNASVTETDYMERAPYFPRGIDLHWGASPGDYPPLGSSIEESSSPLVPAGSAHSSGGGRFAHRALEGDSLDLITGVPLLREVDFELPFGSAVYRHVRTYSETTRFGAHHSDPAHRSNKGDTSEISALGNPLDYWWGSHGTGWMNGTNPLFLVDAEQGGGEIAPFGPRRCIFVPDAHHAIPFEMMETSGLPRYVAPPWIDANLTYERGGSADNCVWDANLKVWTVPPDRFTVSLYGGEVVYRIRAFYEDVTAAPPHTPETESSQSPSDEFVAALRSVGDTTLKRLAEIHGSQATRDNLARIGARGTPHYGLVESILDKSGNRIEIHYDDGHGLLVNAEANGECPERSPMRLQQEGYRKGMITHVELWPAGETTTPAWTLVYTYRTFINPSGIVPPQSGDCDELDVMSVLDPMQAWDAYSLEPALHSVIAYRSSVDVSSRDHILMAHPMSGATPTTPPFVDVQLDDDRCELFTVPKNGLQNTPLDHQDTAIGPGGEGNDYSSWTSLPKNWVQIAEYSYSEPEFFDSRTVSSYTPADNYFAAATGEMRDDGYYELNAADRIRSLDYSLLRVVSSRRIDSSNDQEFSSVPSYWMYRYQDIHEGMNSGAKRIFGHATGENDPAYGDFNTQSNNVDLAESQQFPRRLKSRFGPTTVARLLAGWDAQKQEPGLETAWFYSAASDREYLNGLISAADWTSIAWAINEAAFGALAPSNSVVPIDALCVPWDDPLHCHDGPGPGGGGPGGGSELYRMLALHHLADATYLGWNQQYRFAPPDDPAGLTTTDWAPGEVPTMRWHRPSPQPIPDGGEVATLTSWAEYWATGPSDIGVNHSCYGSGASGNTTPVGDPSGYRTNLRENYLGKLFEGDTGTLAELRRVGFLPGGASVFIEGAAGSAVYRRVYRFVQTPSDDTWIGPNHPGNEFAKYPGPEVIQDVYGADTCLPNFASSRALYKYPYRFTNSAGANSSAYHSDYGDYPSAGTAFTPNPNPGQRALDEVMWWTVIDEFPTYQDLATAWETPGEEKWTNRRIVGLNPAGWILHDQTWTDDGLEESRGILSVSYEYDSEGRLTAERSRGWAATLADDNSSLRDSEGLITTFEYDDPEREDLCVSFDFSGTGFAGLFDAYGFLIPDAWKNCAESISVDPSEKPGTEVKTVSIKKGLNGTEHALTELEWDDQDNVVLDRRFALGVPTDSISGGSPVLSETATTFEYYPLGTGPDDPKEPTVKKRLTAGAPIIVRPGGQSVHPFECEIFAESGQRIWRIYGLKQDVSTEPPNTANDDEVIYVDYTQYDDIGRVVLSIRDIKFDAGGPVIDLIHARDADNITTTVFLDGELDLLGGYVRKHPVSAPLNEATVSQYNDYGRYFLLKPNGLRTLTDWSIFNNALVELQALGVYYDEQGNARLGTASASDYRGGQLSETRSFSIDDQPIPYPVTDPVETILNDVLGEDGGGGTLASLLTTLVPSYDSNGQITSLKVTTPDRPGEQLDGYIFKNGWGQLVRSENTDGDVTRHTYDLLGRLFKTFRGTSDSDTAWRGVDDPASDDMVLTERLFYGTGITDASLPIHRWTFNTVSSAQYGNDVDEVSEGDTSGLWVPELLATSTSISPGQREDLFYDWRMRQIGTMVSQLGHFDPSDPLVPAAIATRTEVTWLDNADRVRFRAVYDGDATSVITHADGPDTLPGGVLPGADQILAIDPGVDAPLVSLEETIYSTAGHVQETRRYDPESPTPSYMFTQTFSDHDGRPVWSRSGREITENLYNAKGQLIETRRHATMPGSQYPVVEISRTVNTYDAVSGLLLTTETRERLGAIDADGFPVSNALGTLPLLDAPGAGIVVTRTDHWYDDEQRVIATAEYGNGSTLNRLDDSAASFPARPDDLVLLFHETTPVGDEPAEHWLKGYTYPSTLGFDQHGRAIALITCFDYDQRGKLRSTFRTTECYTDGTDVFLAGTSTWTKYSGHGQKDIELTFGYEPDEVAGPPQLKLLAPHGMAYAYEGSRLVKVASVLPDHFGSPFDATVVPSIDWTKTDGSLRITGLDYDAPVLDAAHGAAAYFAGTASSLSTRPDLVSAVYGPDPATGQPSTEPAYQFVYRVNGELAGRLDARGVTVEHAYDDEDRLASLTYDIPTDGSLPAYDLLPSTNPTHPIRGIGITRDERGRVVLAEMLNASGVYNNWSKVEFQHDTWGNVTSEVQTQGLAALAFPGGASGVVDYAWTTGPTSNENAPGANTSRLDSISYPAWLGGSWDSGTNPSRRVVNHDYGPAGHFDDVIDRVTSISSAGGAVDLGHIASYTYHGRSRLAATALGDVDGSTATPGDSRMREILDRDRHGRIGAQTIQRHDGVWVTDPIFEAVHGHDEAGRRLFTRLRQADVDTPGDRDNIRSWLYEYDTFGKLTGALQGQLPDLASLPGNPNHYADPGFTIAPAGAYELAFELDRHGNRVGFDDGAGTTVPGFYEGFGDADADGFTDPIFTYTISTDDRDRLTGRTDTGTAPVDPAGYVYDAAGNLIEDGRFLYHYDALSRLVAVEDTTLADDPADPDDQLVLSLAYDPLGRLIHRLSPWEAGASATRIELFRYEGARRIQDIVIDPYPVSIPGLTLQLVDPPGGPGQAERRLDGELIYAAYGGAGPDRPHVVVDWWERDAWLLTDPMTSTVHGFATYEGEVVEQYAWSPFGRLLDHDVLEPAEPPSMSNGFQAGPYIAFRQRAGHQGLMAEPLAGAGQALDLQSWSLEAGRPLVYHNRNRTYDPFLGRFLQHDPNATGQTLAGLAYEGKLGWTDPSAFDAMGRFGDGGNLYAAYGHDPVNATDPSGLFLLLPGLQTTGKRLGQSANAYDTGQKAIGIAEDLASGISMQQIMLSLAIDAIFDKVGGRAFDAAISGAQRAGRAVRQGCRRTSSCVPPGTQVETLEGPRPIEDIEIGDYVLAVDHFNPASDEIWTRVEGLIRTAKTELVRLSLADGRRIELTPDHLIWTDQSGWIEAGELTADDLVHTLAGPPTRVLSAERMATPPTPVYSLQVAGARTYYAGGVWVHNSCVQTNQIQGFAAEDRLRRIFPGVKRRVDTSDGSRHIDNLFQQFLAQEVKTGKVGVSSSIRRQIAKDAEILQNGTGGVVKYEWHFFKSEQTGKIGPTDSVRKLLDDAGIDIIIHR